MRLRKPCEHDRYEAHSQLSEGGHPESSIAYFDCPGGEFLPEDALVIEKVNGEWNISALAAMEMELEGDEDEIVEVCERMLDALASRGEPA